MSDYIIQPGNLTTSGTDFDKLFGNYTKFMFDQLRHKYINDTGFFALAPNDLRNYYFLTLKRNLEWYRGAVFGIHQYGIFSCFQGAIACNTVADLVAAGDFRIEAKDSYHKKYIEEMLNYTKFRKKMKKALPMWLACGYMLATIDVKKIDDWTLSFTSGNRYFVEVDDSGKIFSYKRMLRFRTASLKRNDYGYYLVEERWLKSSRCFHRYQLFEGKASCDLITSTLSKVVNVPNNLKAKLQAQLGAYELDKIYELPFKNHVGAVVILSSKNCTGIEDHPELCDSLLEHSHQFLLEYDEIFTSKQKDRVMADKGVLLPDSLMPSDLTGQYGVNGYYAWLDFNRESNNLSNVYKRIKSMNPDDQKPFFFQSEYRQNDYNADLDQCKARIADSIKISPSDFGSHTQLGDGTADKTATEVRVLTGITKTTVEEMRAAISDGMEELFRIILQFAFRNTNAKCSMIFNSSQSANPQLETEDLIQQLNANLIPRRVAIQRKNPNLSQEEIEQMITEIDREQTKKMSMEASLMGGLNDYQSEAET